MSAAHEHPGPGEPDHRHHHHTGPGGTRLAVAAGVNVGFAVVQIVVGLALASVAVLADAAHQVVDAIGLLTALSAVLLARRPASNHMSYGWGKADALGGLVSGLLLLGSAGWIAYEAIDRLRDPTDVSGTGVIVIGVIAVAVNGGSVLLVGRHDHQLSLRAARLHLLTDLAGSLIVVATGVVLAAGGPDRIDPIASLLLVALVLHATVRLLRRATQELLDRAPVEVTPETIKAALSDLRGVEGVHHVHSRPLGGGKVSVTAHVVVDGEQSLHEAQGHLSAISTALAERLGVAHTTLQLECHACEDVEH